MSLVAEVTDQIGGSHAQSGSEPPSGLQGKGTVNSPYDGGNAPEEDPSRPLESGTEPPSGVQGEGTVESPYDKGNAPETAPPSTPTHHSSGLESPSTTHQGSGLPTTPPNSAQTKAIRESTKMSEAALKKTPGTATGAKKSTGVAAEGGNFDAAARGAASEAERLRSMRDVSPGTMPDGSHAITHGDRGESYAPSTMNRLKGKFHLGK